MANYYGQVHGEFTSADASALTELLSRITLYHPVTKAAVSIDAGDVLVITDLQLVVGAAITVTVYDGADATPAAGEVICRGNFGANGGVDASFRTPHYCKQATWPKVKGGAAGQIDVSLRGRVMRAGELLNDSVRLLSWPEEDPPWLTP